MVLTRPTFNDIVTPLSNYAATLAESQIKAKNIEVTALGEDIYWIESHPPPSPPSPGAPLNNCTRTMLESALTSKDPIFYANFGHGKEDCIVSTDNCLVDLLNVGLLKDRVVYAFACLTASQLGPAAIARGCKTYVGWNDVIYAVYYEYEPGAYRPADGNTETMAKFPVEFASGLTTEEAFQKALEEYDKWISYWEGKDPNCYSQFAWNKQHLVLLGDKTERIISPLEFQLNQMMSQLIPVLIMIVIMSILTSIIGLLTGQQQK
jgi:hypothetical protein